MKTIGLVLMGGMSSRFGSSKADFVWQGKSLALHAVDLSKSVLSEVYLVARPEQEIADWGQNGVILDDVSDSSGPLRGIFRASQVFTNDNFIVIPCDAPWIHTEILSLLIQAEIQTPALCCELDGKLMPFPSLWTPDSFPFIAESMQANLVSPRQCLQKAGAGTIPQHVWQKFDPKGQSFVSANTPKELI